MSENKENSKKRKCPVCGRFASAEAVERHEALERGSKAMRKALDECKGELDTAKASLSAYSTENGKLSNKVENQRGELAKKDKIIAALKSELSGLRLENAAMRERVSALSGRGLWARIINRNI